MLDHALRYRAAGLSIIPIDPRTKRPFFGMLPQERVNGEVKRVWTPFQREIADEATVRRWFGRGDANIGIVAGAVSGGLLVLDFDTDAERTYAAWCTAYGSGAQDFPTVKTAKGYHVYARCEQPGGNRNLALSINGSVLIQTRGEGGYVVAPPSVHPSGHIYELIYGDFATIPTLV